MVDVPKKLKILTVDDETDYSDLFSKILPKDMYFIKGVDSGKKALNEIRKYKYDLILLDMKMPVMDGVATIEAIRKIDQKIVFFIITGYFINEEIKKLLEVNNINEIIYKPFNIVELQEKVTQILLR